MAAAGSSRPARRKRSWRRKESYTGRFLAPMLQAARPPKKKRAGLKRVRLPLSKAGQGTAVQRLVQRGAAIERRFNRGGTLDPAALP